MKEEICSTSVHKSTNNDHLLGLQLLDNNFKWIRADRIGSKMFENLPGKEQHNMQRQSFSTASLKSRFWFAHKCA